MSLSLVTILVALAVLLFAFVSSRRFARHVVTVVMAAALLAAAWWLGMAVSGYVGTGAGRWLQVVGGGLALFFPLTRWGDDTVEWGVACFHGIDPERLRQKREARRLAERKARMERQERRQHPDYIESS